MNLPRMQQIPRIYPYPGNSFYISSFFSAALFHYCYICTPAFITGALPNKSTTQLLHANCTQVILF